MRNLVTLSGLGWALVTLGCAYTVEHVPRPYELGDPWPRVAASAPVQMRVGASPSGWQAIDLPAQVFRLDLREYNQSLVGQIEAVLADQDVKLDPQAERWLEIDVVHASILRGGENRFHCVIDFTVRTGDGYVFGHQTRGRSLFPERACNAALSMSAYVTLTDPRVRSHLEQP